MSIEAMKRALKTFEKIHEGCAFVKEDDLHKDAKDLATYVQEDCEFTMKTLRQAIEQAEKESTLQEISDIGQEIQQEPYADKANQLNSDRMKIDPVTGNVSIGTPQAKQWDTSDMAYRPGGLSVEQEKLCKYCGGIGRVVCDGRCMPEQEPVAWMTNSEQDVTAEFLFSHVQTQIHKIPLYEAPPKREWVCKKCGEQNVD
jgi:hypothetical protein